ncbi:hypothetical protein H072_8636 [Dactylellina haptotyla CBS 200.50]|uniref:Uncharacterized protein n=1 Tax=Dactylellina haptotyla (strain CBS 200.50) TaxID=1284197 RepID=S8A974_DACHA|nr:hypothetical protein H072_8636 [Dactylellina haptotyla CBS 200.50]
MAQHKLSDFPLDREAIFQSSIALYVKEGKNGLVTLVKSALASSSSTEYRVDLDLDKLATETKEIPPTLRFDSQGWLSRTFQCIDIATEKTLVTLSGPVLAFGHWSLVFSSNSPHSAHTIDFRPAGAVGTSPRDDLFVKDSVLHIWAVHESEDAGGCTSRLYKIVEGKRVEVASFTKKKSRDREGVLLVDESQVDLIIAAATCVAIMKRMDSFR